MRTTLSTCKEGAKVVMGEGLLGPYALRLYMADGEAVAEDEVASSRGSSAEGKRASKASALWDMVRLRHA